MGESSADFLDSRSYGFTRVAVCVPEGRVAAPQFNTESHLRQLQIAHERGAHYALCPELGLSAYSCGDLFFQNSLLRACEDALAEVARRSADWNLVISIGLPLAVGGGLYNCGVTLYRGRPIAVAPKTYLPDYREFYERRWFRTAREASFDTVRLLGDEVPFGNDLLLRSTHLPGFVLHVEICEDLWVPIPPSARATLGGATVLGNLSASNITVAKWEYRQDLVRASSARNIAVQMYSAAGFGESTSDLAWDGHGLIAERGILVGETQRFALRGDTVTVDVDLRAIGQDRLAQTNLGANAEAELHRPLRCIEFGQPSEVRPASVFHQLQRRREPHPFVPADPAKRDERCREVFSIQSTSLARRLLVLPEFSRRIVIGVSGGQDSTHALLVAAHAVDLLGLERSRIIGVTMPGLGTTARTRENALRLIRAIRATDQEIPISQLSEAVYAAIGHPPEQEDVTFENVQAWLRKVLLFATASQRGGIDVGTADLSEIALGFSTYGGDHMSHYAVNSGVPKSLISYVIAWAADVVFGNEPDVQKVLRDVLATPISPELLRPDADGKIAQRSEDIVGPYELHDFFLYHVLRFGAEPGRVARLALHSFGSKYTLAEIRRWLIVFLQRFFANQFKRNCIPDGPKVGSGGSLSPRGDWRMPSDADPTVWLAEAESIPEEIR